MLTIWGRNNSINVQKVMWAVGELGLEHERLDVGGSFGKNDTPEYLAMNPNGRVPTVVDGDTIVWESNSCVRYLAAKYGAGTLWADDPATRSLADRWMDWKTATVIPDMTPVFWNLVRTPEPDRDMQAVANAVANLAKTWKILDDHLADKTFVAGDNFTMGDIPVGAACYRYHVLPIDRPSLPNVAAWYARLQDREPFQAHVMIELT